MNALPSIPLAEAKAEPVIRLNDITRAYGQVQALRDWLPKRLAWMDAQFP